MFRSFNARALGLALPAGATVELAASAGFEGVDLLVRDAVDSGTDLAALRARMADLGLRPGAWPLPVDWRGDASRFALDLQRLPRLAEAARSLGLARTGTWVMPASTEPYQATFDLHVRRLGPIARVLREHGTTLGLEVIGVASARAGRGEPFIHRLADLDPLLRAVEAEAPGVGVLVDAFHLYAAGETLDNALAWGVERVAWVHLADLPAGAPADRHAMRDDDRGLPGEHGAIDCAGILSELARQGYAGPVTAEPMAACRALRGFEARPEALAREVARALHSVWPRAS